MGTPSRSNRSAPGESALRQDAGLDGFARKAAIFGAVLLVTLGLHVYRVADWPWDVDELSSLEELGLLDPSIHQPDRSPQSIVVKLPRLVPVWYAAQGLLLRCVPHDEMGTRVLSVVCGVATVVLVFLFGWQRRGLAFALALAILLDGSQLLVWLSQQNRYYTTATLFLAIATMAIWSELPGWKMIVATGVAALLAVFSHNLLVVAFGLGMVAAMVCYPLGWVPGRVALRAAVAGVLGAVVYVGYVRPIAGDWTGVGFAWTDPFRSFIAHVGVPTLALAGLGSAIALLDREERPTMAWWSVLTAGTILFVAITPWIMPVWNPRYALLFVLPLWMTGALGMEYVARRLPSRRQAAVWYGCVAVLLAPKLVSHYLDGSRHDYRLAAAVVAEHLEPGQTVCANMELQTKYYLSRNLRPRVRFWTPDMRLPGESCLVVLGTNIWDPPPAFDGRPVEVVAQIARRRYDEVSHVVRVYRVSGKAEASSPPRRSDPCG